MEKFEAMNALSDARRRDDLASAEQPREDPYIFFVVSR